MRSRPGQSGRNRAVPVLLTAILAFATVPGYGGTRVAHGQTTIWSAEMVVGDDCQVEGHDCKWGVSWNGWANDYEQWGSISNDQFTYGNPFTVGGVWRNAVLDDVFFLVDAMLPNYQGMTLTVGSVDLALSAAGFFSGCGAGFKWPAVSAVQWTRGDTIPVRLTATDPPPSSDMTVSFKSSQYQATEGGAPAQVEVQLRGKSDHSVYVPFDIEMYGGANGDDYQLESRDVTFAPGENRKMVEVMARDDSDDDDGESVALSIGALSCGAHAGNPSTAMITLVDNDGGGPNGGGGGNSGGGDGNSGGGNSGGGNTGGGNSGGGNSGGGNTGGGNTGGGNTGGGNTGGGNTGGGNSGGGNSGGGNSGGGNSGGGNTGGGNTGGGNTGGGNTGGGNTGGGNTGGGNTGGGNTGGGNTGGGGQSGGGTRGPAICSERLFPHQLLYGA